jgi:hypothetical protein
MSRKIVVRFLPSLAMRPKNMSWSVTKYLGYGVGLLTVIGAGKQAEAWFGPDLSAEDSRKLRNFVVSTKGHEVQDRSPTDSELYGIAETYLDSLFRLFQKLAINTDHGLLITKASWDQANKSLLPGRVGRNPRPRQ